MEENLHFFVAFEEEAFDIKKYPCSGLCLESPQTTQMPKSK
jgi:hypothetical protein